MRNRERALAVLNYAWFDRLPIVHFGFWPETLQKWSGEGHVTVEEWKGWEDGNAIDLAIGQRLGFDFNWLTCFTPATGLYPPFVETVLATNTDGTQTILNVDGAIILRREGAVSIPKEIDHLLKGRSGWEEHYLPRLQYVEERIDFHALEGLRDEARREYPLGIHCGSLLGKIRDWCGLLGLSYLLADDMDLVTEMINTVGDLCYRVTERVLATGIRFDFGHFWEDICFRSGPLVSPIFFARMIAPHYARITRLLRDHGITVISVDCDGKIDKLVPIWLQSGVNTMFPIEVGTWGANLRPWREAGGRDLRGVGGMNKTAFARDRGAIDAEIERLKPLIAMGGYIPCPDHRLAPDARWENVHYYCERLRALRA